MNFNEALKESKIPISEKAIEDFELFCYDAEDYNKDDVTVENIKFWYSEYKIEMLLLKGLG